MATLLLIIIYLAFISLGLPDSILGSAWPSMYGELGAPVSFAGALSMIVTFGTIISSLLSERLIHRFGTGVVTAVSVSATAVALVGFAFSPNLIWLCLFAVPLGLGAGSVDAALNNFVALHYKASHMNWLHCFWGLGATLGPYVMSLCLRGEGGWKAGYSTIGGLQAGLALILFITLPLWKKALPGEAEEEKAGGPVKLRSLLALKGAKPALTAFFCYCGLELTAGLWGSSFLVMTRGIPAKTAAGWISLFYLGITLGRLVSGFLSMKVSSGNLIRIGEGLIGLGALLLLLPVSGGLAETAVLCAGLFCIGLGCAPVYPCLIHETPAHFGREYSQAAIGMQMACAYVGSTVVPPVFGLIAQMAGTFVYPLYLLLLAVIMTVMSEQLNRKSAG